MQQKWLSKLMGFDYEISYKCGKANTVVDALSRPMEDDTAPASQSTLAAMTVVLCNWVGALQDSWKQDDKLQ